MEQRLNELLMLALKNHATDIHFTLKPDSVLIELRINKKLYSVKPKENDQQFYRYLMYRANLDLALRSMPQTGNFALKLEGQKIALRFACLNAPNISCGVLRLLNNHEKLQLEDLSYDRQIINHLKQVCQLTCGLVIFSGPTSSGKTTTLYTLLQHIQHKKIYTLEDPIEVYDDHYVQLQINEANNFSYAQGIKQLMRHDPDIIMIGEIRDEIAAKMAVRCALTGHLVFTTIHASNCLLAIERMLELDVPSLQLKDSLSYVFNQRLMESFEGFTGIYEVLDPAEIAYFFNHKSLPIDHETMEDKLAKSNNY
ncbi:MAG: Flp pilus assembly complex ATPase component TadA [Erysipelotrichaceae bacterium]|nr:Flp pilus assembly complex ATPase component TadA [Erysipelotrichaceae bacterium]MDY5252301.1 ATPase, T2SS/T4P/T4SS family [Erysipelotrichaceae bacterium]